MAVVEAAIAILICGGAAGLEAFLSGPRPFAFLKSLQQPTWSLSVPGWITVGIAFYTIIAIVLARLFVIGWAAAWGVTFIIGVLVTDAFWNFLFFRLRRFDLAYYYLFPYSLIVIGALISAYAVDALSAILIALYVIFLPFDVAWVQSLRRLNPQFDGSQHKPVLGTDRN